MEVGIILKMAGLGVLITVVCQVLKKSEREDIATIVGIVGVVLALGVAVSMVGDLFTAVKTIFGL